MIRLTYYKRIMYYKRKLFHVQEIGLLSAAMHELQQNAFSAGESAFERCSGA